MRAYWQAIVERPEPSRWQDEVTPADAQGYVERGRSVILEYSEFRFVSDPDAHTASWLSHEELWAALAHHDIDPGDLHPTYQALLAVLSALAELNPRVVFWFDN